MKKITILFLLSIFVGCTLPYPLSFDIQYSFTYNYIQTTPNLIEITVDLHISNFGYETKSIILSFEGDEVDGNHFGFRSHSITLNASESKDVSFDSIIGVMHDPTTIENLQVTRVKSE